MNISSVQLSPAKIHRSGVIANVTINICDDIRNKFVELPEFRLSDAAWSVKLLKKSLSNGENTDVKNDVIAIYLVSKFDNDTFKWSCDARAVFKLLPTQNNVRERSAIVKYLSKQSFTNDCCEHGIDNFIEWNQFVENYVCRQKAVFEIEIYTNPLLRTVPRDIQEIGTVFHFIIRNVSTEEVTHSEEFNVRGIRWKVRAQKQDGDLAVYLCAAEDDLDVNWFWNTTVTFKLLPFIRSEPIERTFSEIFRWGTVTWGTSLIKWADFIDPTKHYIANNSAIIFCEFNVHAPEPMWNIDPIRMIHSNQ